METFVTAYLAVGFAVVLYVGRLGMRQYLLQERLDALRERMEQQRGDRESAEQAA